LLFLTPEPIICAQGIKLALFDVLKFMLCLGMKFPVKKGFFVMFKSSVGSFAEPVQDFKHMTANSIIQWLYSIYGIVTCRDSLTWQL